MYSTWKIILLFVAFLAAVSGISWMATKWKPPSAPASSGMKNLSGTVAEHLVYRSAKEIFPRATCDACRMGRIKVGVFSLGGFSTIEFDNLVVNLPEEELQEMAREGNDSQDAVAESLALKPLAGLSGARVGRTVPKFSGITINGLSINKVEGETLVPILKAKTLKNSKQNIILKDVTLYRGEDVENIPEATFVTKPCLKLEWPEGSYSFQLSSY